MLNCCCCWCTFCCMFSLTTLDDEKLLHCGVFPFITLYNMYTLTCSRRLIIPRKCFSLMSFLSLNLSTENIQGFQRKLKMDSIESKEYSCLHFLRKNNNCTLYKNRTCAGDQRKRFRVESFVFAHKKRFLCIDIAKLCLQPILAIKIQNRYEDV